MLQNPVLNKYYTIALHLCQEFFTKNEYNLYYRKTLKKILIDDIIKV